MWYGIRLIEGRGVHRDIEAGIACIMLSSQNGLGQASFKIARAYKDGTWLPKNEKEAMRYLELAKEQYFVEAAIELDMCRHLARKGLPAPAFISAKDYDDAMTVLKIGDIYAENAETGLRAQEFYMRAFDLGHTAACLKIAAVANKNGKKTLYPAALEYLCRGVAAGVKDSEEAIAQFIRPQIVKDDRAYRKKVVDILFKYKYFERAAGVFLAANDTSSYQNMMWKLEQTDSALHKQIKQKYKK